MAHYRKVVIRTLNDFLDVKKYIGKIHSNVFITDLEKLGNLEYLNNINKILSIGYFKEYPPSTVLGIKRGGDLLSGKQKDNSYGAFNSSLVKRGNPFKRLGFIDATIITLISSKRIKEYKFNTKHKFLDYLVEIKYLQSLLLLCFFLIFPTKFEILYILESILNVFRIIKCNKKSIKQKLKQLIQLVIYFILYPIEFILLRFFKLKLFYVNHTNPEFIKEINSYS